MKNIVLLLFFSLLIHPIQAQECYELVWSDEFEYNGAPDPEKWSFDIGGNGWGNNEDQYYTDRLTNAQVSGGALKITARKESFGGKSYTSARVISKNTGDWLYGKIEVRAKLPTGQGTWPAIWMLPTDWEYGGWPASGEIDIMEHVGYDQNVVHATVHTEAYNHSIGTQVGKSITDLDVSTAFHTYKLEWTEDEIKVYLDDQQYFTFSKHGNYQQWPFDKRFHLLMNIAMGGNWGGAGGPTDDSKLPATMEVEYVRVYQNITPELSITGPKVISKGEQSIYTASGAIGEVTWTLPEGAEIIAGENTNKITVLWGDEVNGSTITASVAGECNTYTSSYDLSINQGVPTQSTLTFNSNNENGSSLWLTQAQVEGSSDAVDPNFEVSSNDTLTCVKFDVSDPTSNPRIEYHFKDIYSFENHNNFSINLKFGKGLAPKMLRIDLLDASGNVIDGDIFESNFNQLNDDCNLWSLSYQYDPSKLDLKEIGGIRMYINYGIFSTPKRGAFEIGSFTFSESESSDTRITSDDNCGCIDDIPLSTDSFSNENVRVYPNPISGNGSLKIFGTSVDEIEIMDLQGRVIEHYKNVVNNTVQLEQLSAGLYIINAYSKSEQITLRMICE
ncbi:family 16 glycosylhydrolase [Flammeovirga sp. SJP92]|uniref:family 16 glycosylhydrolase n=1 Tax=Flammeovirga sp. SJP92 TaxID=1775430 RepID=UPI000AC60038|nr:family 16 glycosylhydrolase [Flammeovirga sp. SJP92]